MICACAGRRRHALDRIQPVHRRRLFGTAARGEIASVAEAAGAAAEEVGVERENHVGAIEAVLALDVFAERELRARARVVAARGIPLMPPGRRVAAEEIANLGGERRRADRLGQQAKAAALERLLGVEDGANRTEESRPRANLAEAQ